MQWLYNDSPVRDTVVTNDRWGIGTNCQDGGFWTCQDRYNPGHLVNHAWENCFTLETLTWGYAQNAPITQYLSVDDVIYQVVSTIAYGGNCLINVGPTSEGISLSTLPLCLTIKSQGIIPPIFQERLFQLGAFLQINGNAIFSSIPWSIAQAQNDVFGGVYYTSSSDSNPVIYAIVLKPSPFNGKDNTITLYAPVTTRDTMVTWLSDPSAQIGWKALVKENVPGEFLFVSFLCIL